MAQQYGEVNEARFMQRFEESQSRPSGGSYANYWKPKAGELGKMAIRNVVRPLPPHPNMDDVIVGTKVHFSLGPQTDTACPCLEPYGEACPACDWVDHLFKQAKNEPNPVKAQQYRDLAFRQRAKLRFFMNIVDLAKPEDGVQTWAFSGEVEKMVRSCFLDDQMPPKFRNISHPETGRAIIMEVSTKPLPKKQNETMPSIDTMRPQEQASALNDPAWLDHLKDLTEEVYKPSTEQVQDALQGKKVTRTAGQLHAAPPTSALPAAAPPAAAPTPPRTPVAASAPALAPAPPAAAPTPVASAPAPPPVAPTPPAAPAGRARRQPVADAPKRQPVADATDPMEQARQKVLELGAAVGFSTPKHVNPDVLATLPKPSCYGRETDPTDGGCQDCSVLVACMGVKLGLVAA
jgi:hypothetical protein